MSFFTVFGKSKPFREKYKETGEANPHLSGLLTTALKKAPCYNKVTENEQRVGAYIERVVRGSARE